MGIDPSINHTGYGIIENDTGKIVSSGVIQPKCEGNGRYTYLSQALAEIINTSKPCLCAVEWPTFENSKRGKALVKFKGFNKLCAVAGIAIGLIGAKKIPCSLITAFQWKRETTKPNIKHRVEELTGKTDWISTDEWEALGIAFWARKHHNELEWI